MVPSAVVRTSDAQLIETWLGRGLAATELALRATITPETLAGSRTAAAGAHDQTAVASVAPSSRLTIATLPLIEVGEAPRASDEVPGPAIAGDILVTGLLGEGGMGRVLSARQRSLSRDVAVKTVRPEDVSAHAAEGIVREGLITGHLEHPNITPVHQLGRDPAGRPVMVMKRIVGVAWSELLADATHPAWKSVAPDARDRLEANVEILMQLCNGLSFAHARNVIHRDIKTDNVMIGEFGEVYLCDWGIAIKVSDPDDTIGFVGTPCYLAPEMLDPNVVPDARTDVYLLGATLHHVLVGTPRHDGKDLRSVLASALASTPVAYDDEVPEELARLCNRATHVSPTERPPTAAAFRAELASFLSHRSSVELARTTEARLDELKLDEQPLATRDRAELETLALKLAGCRVGFEHALDLWSENPRAASQRRRVLAHALALELRRENVAAARSLAKELGDEAGTREVEALEAVLAQRERDAGAFQRVRHETDFAVASPIRTRILFGMIGVGCAFGLTSLLAGQQPAGSPSPFFTIVPPALIFTAGAIGAWMFRRRLFVNQANKRLVGIMLGEIFFSLVHRATAIAVGEEHGNVMRTDVFLLAGAIGAAGAFVSSRWVAFSFVLVAAACAMKLVPDRAFPIFVSAHLSALLVLAFGWKTSTADP